MKFPFLTFFLLTVSSITFGQTDSLAVVNADWKVNKIAPGIRLKQMAFDSLFNSNQYISVLEVRQRGKRFFDLGYDPQVLRKTSDFGKAANAIAALNGTFFDIKNGGSVDFIESDDKVINLNRLNKDGQRALHQQSAILFKDGKISIARWNREGGWEESLQAQDIMVTGPLLLLDGERERLDTANAFSKTRHPRTAVGVTKKNRVLLIAVDGTSQKFRGIKFNGTQQSPEVVGRMAGN